MSQTDYWNGSYTWPAIGPRLFENSQQLTQDIPARGRYCEAYNNYQDPDYHCDGPATASKIVQKTTTDDLAEGNPTEISLARNYPNPFNPTTQIMYTIPKKSHVQLTVYDRLGRKVATLVDEIKSMGNYTTSFDASNLSSGMYFYILEAENKTLMQKMTLIK